ncbi:serine/threonine-protein kinase 26-like isoform X2 [Biomphalaria glabrata]|nr:serine/threonine-protein kinase 26-like isoform X2 [Biomphalaria glabrata]
MFSLSAVVSCCASVFDLTLNILALAPKHVRSRSDNLEPVNPNARYSTQPLIERPKSQYDLPNYVNVNNLKTGSGYLRSNDGPDSHGSLENQWQQNPQYPYKPQQFQKSDVPPAVAPKPAKKREPERPQMSASLTSTVQPILVQLQDEYNNELRRLGRPLALLEVIKELQNAFDLSERSCPGLTDDFVSGILTRLLAPPSPSTQISQSREADVRRAMEKIKRS